MQIRAEGYGRDLIVRLCGLVLLLIGALAIGHLFHIGQVAIRHQTSAVELGLAAVGFVGLTVGAMLTVLGNYVFRRIPIANRWRPLPGATQQPRTRDRQVVTLRCADRSPHAGALGRVRR